MGLDSCVDICVAGKFADSTMSSCEYCGIGKYNDQSGQSFCTPMNTACSAGVGFSSASATGTGFTGSITNDGTCFPCVNGKYKAAAGALACDSCLAGEYTDQTTQDECKKCPPGKTLSDSGNNLGSHDHAEDCELCPIAKYNPFEGHGEACLECLTSKTTGTSVCDGCNPGTYRMPDKSCTDCPQGWYTDLRNQDICSVCGKGKFSNANQSKLCQSCPRGTHGNEVQKTSAADACQKCNIGRYSDLEGLVTKDTGVGQTCTPCAAGRWSDTLGAVKES